VVWQWWRRERIDFTFEKKVKGCLSSKSSSGYEWDNPAGYLRQQD
jgi:hypothetical protein